MKQNIGFILKKYFPKKIKLSVLDSKLGKIDCVPNRTNICLGALIRYNVVIKRTIAYVENIDMITIPLTSNRSNLLFYHHVLELCYYFIPAECPVTNVFSLLAFLCLVKESSFTVQQRKFFLCKLFFLFGIYPEDKQFQQQFFHRVMSESIDILVNATIDLRIEREVDKWLMRCLAVHPSVNYFKTVCFLSENRVS